MAAEPLPPPPPPWRRLLQPPPVAKNAAALPEPLPKKMPSKPQTPKDCCAISPGAPRCDPGSNDHEVRCRSPSPRAAPGWGENRGQVRRTTSPNPGALGQGPGWNKTRLRFDRLFIQDPELPDTARPGPAKLEKLRVQEQKQSLV